MPNTFRDEDCCPDASRYRDGVAPGTYLGAVGGWSALWFTKWVDAQDAEGRRSRWKVLGHLQVAQAVLANPEWPLEDAVCALQWAVHHYRRWAYESGRVGDARDAHDIARYLYVSGVTADKKPFLRPGLTDAEERRRRYVALKVLRVAQCDVARWLEQQSPATLKPMALSTAFRVPGLPLNWRTNPYVPDWSKMPFGFTRPAVAMDMIKAGIPAFPYAFSKRDPNLRDWPEKDGIIDDAIDLVKDAWSFVTDRAVEVLTWVCNNQEVFSGICTGLVVLNECVGTLGSGCAAAAASAPAQYVLFEETVHSGCATVAVAMSANIAWNWEDNVKRITRSVVSKVGMPAALTAEATKVASTALLIENLVADALTRVRSQAAGLVEDELDMLFDTLNSVAETAGSRDLVKPLLDLFVDRKKLSKNVMQAVEDRARRVVTEYVKLRVQAMQNKFSSGKRTAVQQVFADVEAIHRVAGAPSKSRAAARQALEQTRRTAGYGGMPATVFMPPEQGVLVTDAILVGVHPDIINEVLYQSGPVDGGRGPSMNVAAVFDGLRKQTIEALQTRGVYSVYIQGDDDPGEVRNSRTTLRNSREVLVTIKEEDLDVSPGISSRRQYTPSRMLGPAATGEYKSKGPSVPMLSVQPAGAEQALVEVAADDITAFLAEMKKDSPSMPVSLVQLYRVRALQNTATYAKRYALQQAVDRVRVKAASAKTQAAKAKVDHDAAVRRRRAAALLAAKKRQSQGSKAKPFLFLAGAGWLVWKGLSH